MDATLVGRTVAGKYEIRRLLGEGGMGAVYEGRHVEIGKRVAIKVIGAHYAGSGEVAERFRREARAASAVESDHIVQVFDAGKDAEIGLFMVMELLAGEDLASRLAREGKLPVETAIVIARQAARALAKAHAAGVIHRDLKPANLFLTNREDESLHVKVLDFGISKLVDEERAAQSTHGASDGKALTRRGAVIGTPQYMSPEQAQGLPVTASTDVWSLGAVLYEMLAGRSPFPELPTYEQTIIQIVTKRPEPVSSVAPHVPANVATLVDRCLGADAPQRPKMEEVARALAEASGGRVSARDVGAVAPPSDHDVDALVNAPTLSASDPAVAAKSTPTADGVAVPPASTPRRPLVLVGAVVAAAIVGVVALLAFRGAPPSQSPPPAAAATTAAPVAAPPVATEALSIAPLAAVPSTPAVASAAPDASAPVKVPRGQPAAGHAAKTGPGQYGGAGVDKTY